MASTANPYAPPKAEVADVIDASTEAEAIRKTHLQRESEVRSVGTLFMTAGVLAPVTAMVLIAFGIQPAGTYVVSVLCAMLVALAAFSFLLGRAVRALQAWSHSAAVIMTCFGLLIFPLGFLLDIYILYLLLGRQGRYVFRREYGAVVAATPHIKPIGVVVLWVLTTIVVLGTLLLLFVSGVRSD